jgi:RNA polymerase sigma-70 factor (ECF subfamily)
LVESQPKDLNERNDEELIAMVARGNEMAFEILVDRYERPLATFCFGFMRDTQRSEDIMQEAFLRVFRNAHRYRPVARFSTWLYRIATNLCINELKKQRLRQTASIDQPLSPDPDSTKVVEKIASNSATPLTQAEEKELQALLVRAVEALPDDQRTTLIMVEFNRMPYKEIAEVLGITVSAVKMRIKRARENLRQMFKFLEDDEG